MNFVRMFAFAAGLAIVPAAFAEGPSGKVFKEHEVTESALIDALTPSKEHGTRSRSIKVQSDSTAQAPAKPSGGAASLLITFRTASTELTPQAKRQLDVVAKAMSSDKLVSMSFAVEGHADPRGGDDYNLRLSQERAESVAAYLADQHNIGRERLKPIGKGQTEPLNTQRADAPENRRVTFRTLTE